MHSFANLWHFVPTHSKKSFASEKPHASTWTDSTRGASLRSPRCAFANGKMEMSRFDADSTHGERRPLYLRKIGEKNPSALWIRDIQIEAWEKIAFSLAPPPALVAQHFVLWIIVRCGKNCRCASKNWFSLGKNWDAFDWLRGNFKWGKFRFVKKKWKGKKNIFYHKEGI